MCRAAIRLTTRSPRSREAGFCDSTSTVHSRTEGFISVICGLDTCNWYMTILQREDGGKDRFGLKRSTTSQRRRRSTATRGRILSSSATSAFYGCYPTDAITAAGLNSFLSWATSARGGRSIPWTAGAEVQSFSSTWLGCRLQNYRKCVGPCCSLSIFVALSLVLLLCS